MGALRTARQRIPATCPGPPTQRKPYRAELTQASRDQEARPREASLPAFPAPRGKWKLWAAHIQANRSSCEAQVGDSSSRSTDGDAPAAVPHREAFLYTRSLTRVPGISVTARPAATQEASGAPNKS